jgi:hypothetical protein
MKRIVDGATHERIQPAATAWRPFPEETPEPGDFVLFYVDNDFYCCEHAPELNPVKLIRWTHDIELAFTIARIDERFTHWAKIDFSSLSEAQSSPPPPDQKSGPTQESE